MLAVVDSKIDAVNYLLDNSADFFLRSQSGENLLYFASEAGNVTIIETVLSRGLDVDCKDSDGATPLMLTVVDSKIDAVNYLLDNTADFFMTSQSGENLLYFASEAGNVTIIETVLSRGLDVDCKDSNGTTPLMLAVVDRCRKLSFRQQRRFLYDEPIGRKFTLLRFIWWLCRRHHKDAVTWS